MRHQTNSKPSVRRYEHEAMRDRAAAANHIKNPYQNREWARIYFGTHLDAPRSASSQCLLDDADIAATVKDAIDCISTVADERLEVGVKNGWATLRGNLDSWARRETVEHIALHSVGVRGVVNSITVDENRSLFYENP